MGFFASDARVILILTAGFGDGHNTAARSVMEALNERLGDGHAEQCDLFSETLPRLTGLLQFLYQVAITHAPWAWKAAYLRLSNPELGRRSNFINRALQQRLSKMIAELNPEAIVSTYPFYATLLSPLRAAGPVPPLITVITDSVSVHSSWTNDPSDHYCVADVPTQEVLLQRDIPASAISVAGFPVSPAFATPLPSSQAPTNRRLIYFPSTPGKHVAATLEALRPLLMTGVQLTLPVGKHRQRLHHIITRYQDSLPHGRFEILGWTPRIPELLRTHDVIICKAGGAILHEVLAARTPAVIDYVVPGQEEGNAEMLTSHRCALRSTTAEETARHVEQMLANDGALLKSMQEQMKPPLSLPDAAYRTADVITRHLETSAA